MFVMDVAGATAPRSSPRLPRGRIAGGFTIVELLVVIAIIGVLATLLLPAVQRARESGRKASCANNLRQTAVGCQAYHATAGRFPPGAANDAAPFGSGTTAGTGTSAGSSWAVYILPHVGQAKIAAQWDWTGDSGWKNSVNKGLDTGIISAFLCPSSPLAIWCPNPPGSKQRMSTSFAAILGTGTSITRPGAASASYTPTAFDSSLGLLADDGVLTLYGQVSDSMISDGSSNTLLLGEWSDWIIDTAGKQQDCRPREGFAIGVPGKGSVNSYPKLVASGTVPIPCPHNTMTVRYRINGKRGLQNKGWDLTTSGSTGVWNGGSAPTDFQSFGANLPLNSAHPGGAAVAFADGAVRFLVDDTDLNLLAALACRKDQTPPEMLSP